MWTCRASPPMTRIGLHRAFRLAPRALIFGPHFRLDIVDILVLTVFSNPIMRKPYRILNDLITSILRRNTNDLRTQATTCPNHSGMATRASC